MSTLFEQAEDLLASARELSEGGRGHMIPDPFLFVQMAQAYATLAVAQELEGIGASVHRLQS